MQILGLVLKVSIVALVFATGLKASLDAIIWLWRRPVLLIKSFFAMYVAVPFAAILMVRTLDLPAVTEMAIVVLAICAGAPLLPRKLVTYGGDPHYAISLVVATSLLAVLAVPAWIYILGSRFAIDTSVTPADIARVLAKTFLLPLGAGMVVRIVTPQADKVGDLLLRLATIALGLCAIVILVALRHEVRAVGLTTFLALAGFALAGIAAGHLLGGPDPSNRTSLAVSCTTRHIGLALLVAAKAPSARVLAFVITYVLATVLVSIPYVKWRRRVSEQTARP
jgi:BASS family bile acid:Na+ symporter